MQQNPRFSEMTHTDTVYFYLRHSPVWEIVHSEGHHAFHIGGWATVCHAMVAIL